jgi:hypothetical protein
LLGAQMFKVVCDDTKRRCQTKSKQRKNEELSAALAKKLFNGDHCEAEPLIEIQFFYFFILILLFLSDFVSLK